MDKMESSIGGGREGLIYSIADYEHVARKFDAETIAALEAMEASMKVCVNVCGGGGRVRGGHPTRVGGALHPQRYSNA